jgi:carboxyl-terminal processing protease
MSSKTRLSVLLLSTPLLTFVLVGGLIGKGSASGDQEFQHLRMFQEVLSYVMSNYVEEVEVDKAMEGAMRGLADGLDPDSAYLNPAQTRAVEAGETLPDGDVGLQLTRQYYLRVIAARDGSPAAKAGLQTGDYVRAIEGKPTRDMSVFEGSRLLRGQPGSSVTVTVIRGNAAEPHEIVLVREKLSAPAVTGRLMGANHVGYIRVASFGDRAPDEIRRHAQDLAKAGAKALVVDVRRTADGPMENGHAAARAFVKSGTLGIKAVREGAAGRETITAKAGDGAIDLPVAVLVTAGTAGPAELFAAALDGNGRAELVGERTSGRAGVQKLVKLPENRALWLTHARYLTPAGQPIHGRGLQPDVAVEEPDVEFGAPAPANDPILDAALARFNTAK